MIVWGKKTAGLENLTVEQVREAVGIWFEAQELPRACRSQKYEQGAIRFAYYQHRNRIARLSHTKETRRRLRRIGINPDRLRSCVPPDP